VLKKIYIGNLPFHITENAVRELFAPYGDVETVDMIIDNESNQFRGFAFVEMEDRAADKAITGLKGREIEGRAIKVSAARSAEKPAPGNHPGSMLHLRTSRGQFGGHDEFANRTSRGGPRDNRRQQHNGSRDKQSSQRGGGRSRGKR